MELEKSYQMCTKSSMYEYLIRIASQPKKNVLSDALLETLSIIAYKQPVMNLMLLLQEKRAPDSGKPLLSAQTWSYI